jgi:hypothetical protein
MKYFGKTLVAVAALALGHSAMAGNVYLSGSTAYRTAIMTILSTAGGGVFDATPAVTEAYAGSSALGATYANFKGNVGGIPTCVKCNWTGSAGGIYLIAHNADATPAKALFLATSATGTGLANPVNDNDVSTGEVHIVDMAMSDAYQGSSSFTSPGIGTDDLVAVVTFKWVGNYSMQNDTPPGGTKVTNITSQNVKSLYSGAGIESIAQFTGNSADQLNYVFAVGRDFDSGTRIGAFADSGNGSTTVPYQFQPKTGPTTNDWVGTPAAAGDSSAATDTDVQDLRQWNNQVSYPLYNNTLTVTGGNGGYNSGGNLANLMRLRSNTATLIAAVNAPGGALDNYYGYSGQATGVYLLTYLGIGDANKALTGAGGFGNGVELKFNGVSYGTNAIQQGQYSFWGYEHLFYNTLSDTNKALSVKNNLKSKLLNAGTDLSAVGFHISSMAVSRLTDGAPITANYY